MKELGRNLLFGILSLAVFVLLAESAARLLEDETTAPVAWNLHGVSFLDKALADAGGGTMFRPDDELVWALKSEFKGRRHVLSSLTPPVVEERSYAVRTNSDGFRGDEFDLDEASGRTLILCLGDSTTFGLNAGQDETYPARLQAHLDRLRPGEYRVWNAGVPGYTSAQGVVLLAQWPAPRPPDLLLIGYGHNDNSLHQAHFEQMRAKLSEGGRTDAVRTWLARSAAYRAYRRFVVATYARLLPVQNVPTADSYRAMIREADEIDAEVWLLAMNGLRDEVHAAIRGSGEAGGRRLLDFRELFAANGGDQLMSEAVHPNEAGYDLIAEFLAGEIVQDRALRPAATP